MKTFGILRTSLCAFALTLAVCALGAENKKANSANGELAPKTGAPAHKVDINHADAATLQKLPGITADNARAIIAARPFKSMSDLDTIKGLTSERLEQLRNEVDIAHPELMTRHRLGEPTDLEPTGRSTATGSQSDGGRH